MVTLERHVIRTSPAHEPQHEWAARDGDRPELVGFRSRPDRLDPVPPRRIQPDVRVLLRTDEGATAYGLLLPVVELVRTSQEREVVGHLGPDPLRDDWRRDEAVRRMRADPDRPVVAALLDQRVMAGIGNLWANEISLLRAVSPWTRVGDTDVEALVDLAARCCAARFAERARSRPATPDGASRTGCPAGPAARAGAAARPSASSRR